MSDNRRAARAIKVATQCVLVAMIAVAAAEAAVALFFTIRDGEFVSPRDRLTRSPNTFVNAMAEGTNCRYVDTLYPDPYLAHVHFQPPGCKHSYNRIGLEGADIPFVRDPAHFTILLTGGSVAAQVAGVKWRGAREADPVNDTTFLQDELNRCYKPLHGSSFVVLNGADGAWKQPQQAIMTLIYGDVADAVVTLDGFNEHYALDSVRLEMPSGNFAAVNPTATGSYSALASAWVANELIKYVENNWLLSRSFLAYALISATRNGLSAYADDPTHQRDFRRPFKLPAEWSREQRIAYNLGLYRKYVRAIDGLTRIYGARSIFFIQPAPALGKVLTDEERAAAQPLDYGETYQRMTDGLLELSRDGIQVFSLLDIFKSERGKIYADQIHFTYTPDGQSRGNRLIAKAMARRMGDTWQMERICDNSAASN